MHRPYIAAQQQQLKDIAKREAKLARDIKREAKRACDIEKAEALQQKHEQREQEVVSKAAAGGAAANLIVIAHKFIDYSVGILKPKTGEITTPHQSRIILMLYFDLVKEGSTENQAKEQVSESECKDCLRTGCITDVTLLSVAPSTCSYRALDSTPVVVADAVHHLSLVRLSS